MKRRLVRRKLLSGSVSFREGFLELERVRKLFAVLAQRLLSYICVMKAIKGPRVKQLLKELESGKHKSKGIEPPYMGAMRALLEVARKNTHKAYKYPDVVRRKARKYAGKS